MFAYGFVDDDPDHGVVDGEQVVCDPVSLVTGPGNIWVVAAKRLLKGLIGIDAEAGPTEIAILADDTADPEHVAADLVSQAEHDPLAASVLVTDSEELAERTREALARRVAATKHSARVTERARGHASHASCSSTTSTPVSRSSTRTPPSTSRSRPPTRPPWRRGCATRAPSSSARTHRSASATTPRARTTCCPPPAARSHSSGLSVQSFLRGIHVVEYDEAALREIARHVVTLAQSEDLPAHGEAVTARFGDEVPQ